MRIKAMILEDEQFFGVDQTHKFLAQIKTLIVLGFWM